MQMDSLPPQKKLEFLKMKIKEAYSLFIDPSADGGVHVNPTQYPLPKK